MTGDPATQQWREVLGESTSAALRRTQQALAASRADLTRAEQDLAEAREMNAELAKELAAVSLRLTLAEKGPCAWRGFAEDLMREPDGRIYAARQDAGVCVLCGGPIVRGQAVEARHDSTTKPCWVHAVCPSPEGEQS